MRTTAALFAVALIACAPERDVRDTASDEPAATADTLASDGRTRVLEVALVDSVRWETQLAAGVLHRAEVRTSAGVDTIPGVLVADPPRVVGDTAVIGYDLRNGAIERAWRWTPDQGLDSLPVPDDLNRALSFPAIAPDGRHVAYVANRGAAESWPVVRRWPAAEIVVEGERRPVEGTDFALNAARWTAPNRYEVLVDAGTGYLLASGSLQSGIETTEPLAEPPAWASR